MMNFLLLKIKKCKRVQLSIEKAKIYIDKAIRNILYKNLTVFENIQKRKMHMKYTGSLFKKENSTKTA